MLPPRSSTGRRTGFRAGTFPRWGVIWFLALLALPSSRAAAPEAPASGGVSLAGDWRFELDRDDVGREQRWYERSLPKTVQLPGALQNQGFGDDISTNTAWTGAVGVERWLTREEYAPYRQPGNIKVPFFLQPEKHYVGAAWYQRDVLLPEAWAGKRVLLTLERPHWGTTVWLDDGCLGSRDSLGTPHVYELDAAVTPGRHTLTIRVDNRVLRKVGDWSHSVSDHTQGNWNGIIGRLELTATPRVWLDEVQVYPRATNRTVRVRARIGNQTGTPGRGKVSLLVSRHGSEENPLATARLAVTWETEGGNLETTLQLPPDTPLWDEFTPELLTLHAALAPEDRKVGSSTRAVRFGLRDITTAHRQFILNGRPLFFRGTLECCIFPLTGHPPMEVAPWKRIIRTCKEYGLNHIRFHSWCPPEAAFVAADELGFYYQVECGVWTNPGEGKEIGDWIYAESERIVRAYGNHPSFMLLTHGNEPHGKNREAFLTGWVNHWKAKDERRLVTSGSAYPQLPVNQYHVYHGPRGPGGWLGRDYRQSIEHLEAPVIVHEMGQWCAYPDFDFIAKCNGPLRPYNYEIIRDSLARHGMLDQWRDFLRASGRLQVLCYKEEIEAALRTPGVGGVQLLDLHDFPGQGTALVGVLDALWESKGYVTPGEFREFYNSTVPLLRLTKRTFSTAETLRAGVEVAHYGAAPYQRATVGWRLEDARGGRLTWGRLEDGPLSPGRHPDMGRVEISLAHLPAPARYRLVVTVQTGTAPGAASFRNHWDIWVYPEEPSAEAPKDVTFTPVLDDDALGRLARGDRVLLATDRLPRRHPRLSFEPVFWNRYMFNTQSRQTLGLLCQPDHPALAEFPTDNFQDWQWREIVTHARGVVLEGLPADLHPIVQPIDDWNRNRRLGLIFECRVGPGRLLVCSADLTGDLDRRPAARQLRRSLLDYAASDAFQPTLRLVPERVRDLLGPAGISTLAKIGAKVVHADSEDRAHGNLAANAIDGDPDTIWHTRWEKESPGFPHELVIDLGQPRVVAGFRLLPRQDQGNGRFTGYRADLSPNGREWTAAAEGRWAADDEEKVIRFPTPQHGRYFRFVATEGPAGKPWAAIAELDLLIPSPGASSKATE